MLDTTSDYEQHFTGDGINKTFSVSFVVFREEDVVVLIDGAPYGYSFTVLGVGSHSGFSVTLATVPAIGMDVAVLSRPELIRDTDYQLNGDILAEELNRDLDRLWQGLQITAASADALSTLQSGTPTNEAIAEGNTVQGALWKLQGQTLAARSIAYIDTGAGSTYTMTAEESAAASWIFFGGTSDCTVTPVYNTLTQGVKNITTEFSGHDITIDGNGFAAGAYGAFGVFLDSDGYFDVFSLTDGATNSRVFEQNSTTYNLADLINGTYNYFSNASAVTLTVQLNATAAIPANAEYEIEARGAGGLTIVAGTDGVDTVDIIPPKGGSLVLAQGDFVKIKRTNLDEFKLIGTTV
jgi:hypothetical protein